MRSTLQRVASLVAITLLLVWMRDATRDAEGADSAIASRTAKVGDLELHYLTAGSGEPLILLHGYAQTSHMWRAVIPQLATQYLVIAPDLPGIGDSAIPANDLDMKTAALRIHALAGSLGIKKARVVGHDIGLMVAYAYAAQFPTEVEKLALMDAFLPGIGDWERIYHDPKLWHFTFNGPTPEALVRDRERIYLEHFWNDFAADKTHSVPEADRKLYTAAYARPGRMRAGWGYFASFPKTAKDFALLGRTKLRMPVLVIAGERAAGDALAKQVLLVATTVTTTTLKNTGHWVLEENPQQTMAALQQFLADSPARSTTSRR
jgi:pimeloyl-ACP methyl ester carboxylesterase